MIRQFGSLTVTQTDRSQCRWGSTKLSESHWRGASKERTEWSGYALVHYRQWLKQKWRGDCVMKLAGIVIASGVMEWGMRWVRGSRKGQISSNSIRVDLVRYVYVKQGDISEVYQYYRKYNGNQWSVQS